MKPKRFIKRRTQSPVARCEHYVYVDDEPRCYVRCGEPLILFITNSPMPQYEQLVVMRCPEHIYRGDGVLSEERFYIDERGDYHVW